MPNRPKQKAVAAPVQKTIKGNYLRLINIAWWVAAILCVWAYAVGLWNLFQHPITTIGLLDVIQERATQAFSAGLSQLGFTPLQYLIVFLIPEFITTLVFITIGILIRSRRPDDWFSNFASLWMLVFGLAATSTFTPPQNGLVVLVYYAAILFAYMGITVFLLAYPDGKFWPRWTRFVAFAWALFVFSTTVSDWFDWASPFSSLVIAALIAFVFYSQVSRYRNVSTPAQKEQTKWLIVAIAANVILVLGQSLLGYAAADLRPTENLAAYDLLINLLSHLGDLLLVLAVGVAILRYRLWDIEVVVNRTLIYGPLSLILAAIFAVSVALINQTTRQLLGTEATTTSAVVSAVIVALFFQPVRTRIEKWINKRVYPDNNLARELIELSPDIRNLLSLQDIVSIVAQRVTRVLSSRAGAVYLSAGSSYKLAAASQARSSEAASLKPTTKMQAQLAAGRVVSSDKVHLLVPLYVPRLRSKELVGVLAISPRKDGRGYSSDDRRALVELGGEVGTAIYAAQLRAKNKRA